MSTCPICGASFSSVGCDCGTTFQAPIDFYGLRERREQMPISAYLGAVGKLSYFADDAFGEWDISDED